MRIDVVISEWEQACCGASFHVGGQMTWRLLAADPVLTPPGGRARFLEEHHDQTPEDVPHVEVTGVVRAITGVAYPLLPVAGEPRSYTLDTRHPEFTSLHEVSGTADSDLAEYVVELDVDDSVVLPSFVRSREEIAWRDDQAHTEARSRARMEDAVGAVLEAVADYAEEQYASLASIIRDRARSAVTVEPHRSGATGVHWARSAQDDDGIAVHTGDGSWWFSATIPHAAVVRTFLDAAASGRVVEDVADLGGRRKRLDTRVEGEGDQRWVASTVLEPFLTDSGTMVALGDEWERAQRGRHTYPAWNMC